MVNDDYPAAQPVLGAPDFASPHYTFRRTGAVRLVVPGQDDPSERLSRTRAYPLTNVVIDVLTETTSVNELEILSYSGHDQQEHVITPKLRADQPSARNDPIQTGIQQFGDETLTGRSETVRKELTRSAADHLPDSIGIEHCELDLSPLGISPVPTSRLVLETSRETVATNFLKFNPLTWTVRKLARAGKPHVLQTLVRTTSNGKYLVSVRCAVFDPAETITTNREFADHMESSHPFDLAAIWNDAGLVSNFDLPIGDFWKTWGAHAVPKSRNYLEISDSYTARDLYEGNLEYEELRRGRSGYDELYETVLGYPRFPVTDTELRLFAGIIPTYYDDATLWDVAGPRNPPHINTQEVVRAAPGTDHGLGTGTATTPDRDDQPLANTGGEPHKQLLAFALQYFAEQGLDASEVDQTSDSLPDGEVIENGHTLALEIEVSNESKPANLLVNKARAVSQDSPVIFVTHDKQHAESVLATLAQPFRQVTDDGVTLYNWTDAVTLPDGSQPVLPADVPTATWNLTTDGHLELRDDETVLADGPADDSVMAFDYDTPRYEVRDGTHTIVDPDGTVLDEAPTRTTLLTTWTLIRIPHVPLDHHYLADVSIRYKSGNQLKELDVVPTWDRAADGKRDRYAGALSTYLRQYTIEQDGAELHHDRFRDAFQTWYQHRLHTGTVTDPDDTLPSPPGNKEFGVARPDHVETKRRKENDEYVKYIRDYTWVYPTGIRTPDLPFRTTDDTESTGDGSADADQSAPEGDSE